MANSSGGDGEGSTAAIDADRRRLLGLVGGGVAGASAVRVAYELLGYGTVTGTNVTQQPLEDPIRRRLTPSAFHLAWSGYRAAFDGEAVELRSEAGEPLATIPLVGEEPAVVARRGGEYGLAEPLERFAADLAALADGDVAVEAAGHDAFFERLRDADARPLTVAALRGGGFRRPDPEALRAFTGVTPADPRTLAAGLAEGFRERTHFDLARYVAGNVQDHLLRDAVRFRRYLEAPPTFDALCDGGVGMYCWEYALRSLEAFHAVAPHRQSVPVFGAIVGDRRHNHVYTGLLSVVREGGDLRIPLTFLDYSHATMYENYRLRWALGDGVDAYDRRHRVTDVHYRNLYAFAY